MMRTRTTRPAYTLVEVLIALSLTVLLLGGLYVAVDVQLRLAQSGRRAIERATLARTVFARLSVDIGAATTLCDPGRYRRVLPTAQASGGTGTASGGTGTATGTGTGTGTGTATGMTPAAPAPPVPAETNTATPVSLPIGVNGDSTSLHLMTSKVPKETWRVPRQTGRQGDTNIGVRPEDGTELVSDQRLVSYWLGPNENNTGGLARQEHKIVTTEDALNYTIPEGTNEAQYVIVPEARSVQFEYFDGATWSDSWDSNQVGLDGKTPQGPPRAIRITIEIDFNAGNGSSGDSGATKKYSHVVSISTANGTPMIVEDETVPPTTTEPTTSGSGMNP
jgi:hypothetical protein